MPYKDRAVKAESDQKYRLTHKEAIAIRKKVYYLAHKEAIAIRKKVFRLSHKEALISRQKAYWLNNLEEIRIQQREYKKKHRCGYHYYHTERGKRNILLTQQRYYTRKRGLAATLTAEEWERIQQQFHQKCAYCGKTGKLTQDHVIPVSLGGGLTKENIVPACLSCNSAKNDKLIPIGCWRNGRKRLLTLAPTA